MRTRICLHNNETFIKYEWQILTWGSNTTIIIGIISNLEEIYVVKFKITDDFKCYFSEIPQKTLHLNTSNGKTLARAWIQFPAIFLTKKCVNE